VGLGLWFGWNFVMAAHHNECECGERDLADASISGDVDAQHGSV
jgi:hypothetical protein